jgi:hypothetical protein
MGVKYTLDMEAPMKTFTVIYRTGGTENFKWNRVLALFENGQDAVAKKGELEKMGYPSLIHDTHLLDAVGMPETFVG